MILSLTASIIEYRFLAIELGYKDRRGWRKQERKVGRRKDVNDVVSPNWQ